jgi:hypothetical protein
MKNKRIPEQKGAWWLDGKMIFLMVLTPRRRHGIGLDCLP